MELGIDRLTAIRDLWFGFGPVDRRQYAASGFFLAGIKYATDNGIVWLAEQRVWTWGEYLQPFGWNRMTRVESQPVFWVLLLWTLPFLWIGASMTFRRARDAGIKPFVGALFFVPLANYVLMASLCLARSKPESGRAQDPPSHGASPARLRFDRDLTLALLLGAAVAAVCFAVAVLALRDYGWPLFVGSPFIQGFATAWIYGSRRPLDGRSAVALGVLGTLLVAGLLLAVGLEGALCIAMALPFAGFLAVLGAVLGHALTAERALSAASFSLLLPIVPSLAMVLPPAEPALREVVTAIEIDAPPEQVWPHVTSFTQLSPPSRLWFKLGIAYPQRAHFDGEGVGAIRYCEFSTGAFVEPITLWEPPHRLGFDVVAQPPTMHEWSPYRKIEPPHVAESLHSERGEFRLQRTEGGGTRLEGSTWYRIHLFPQPYWTLWSDALIGSIHERVLEHVKGLAESDGRPQSG